MFIYRLHSRCETIIRKSHNKDNVVVNYGGGRLKKDIIGRNNRIDIMHKAFLDSTEIHIWGHNNRIVIQESVRIGKGCSFYMEGNNISIIIGRGTTFTESCHFNAQENNVSIIVGEDCMFSNQIIVRTSDSHPIYSLRTKERINPAKSITIGNHVWIAPNTVVMKGANIGDGSIIGSRTIVSKGIPANCLAVGMPAKVVKEDIMWSREDLFSGLR